MNDQPRETTSAVHFSKAFVGVYGPDAWNPGRAVPDRLDRHETRCDRAEDHQIYLIGESTPPASAKRRFPGTRLVAIKGRPFELHDSGSRSFAREADIDQVLLSLDGKFSIGALCADALVLATDVIGAGPLYYAARGNCILYGTHLGLLLWLLDEAPEANPVGAASVLIARGQIGRETPFRNVFRLQGGERLAARIDGGELQWSLRRYAAIADLMSTGVSQGEAAGHDFGELLEASLVREQYPPDTALMLSGGRDSRALAPAMPSRDIEAVTYGTPDATDLRRGRLLAAQLGVTHRQVPYNSWTYEDFATQIVGLTAGASGLQTAHNIVGFRWAASQDFKLAIVGFLGDAMTGAHLGPAEQVSEQHRRRILCSNLDPFDVDIRAAFPEEVNCLLEIIERQRQELSGLSPTQALMIQDWTVRQACWISTTFDLAEWYTDVSYPFYYRPLMKLMFNRPFSDLQRQHLYDSWLGSAQVAAGGRPAQLRERLTGAIATGSSIIRRRRRPPGRLYWPDVTERSRPWLEHLLATGTGPFLEISRQSYQHALEKKRNRIPTFLLSLPMMLALDMRQNADLLMREGVRDAQT